MSRALAAGKPRRSWNWGKGASGCTALDVTNPSIPVGRRQPDSLPSAGPGWLRGGFSLPFPLTTASHARQHPAPAPSHRRPQAALRADPKSAAGVTTRGPEHCSVLVGYETATSSGNTLPAQQNRWDSRRCHWWPGPRSARGRGSADQNQAGAGGCTSPQPSGHSGGRVDGPSPRLSQNPRPELRRSPRAPANHGFLQQ